MRLLIGFIAFFAINSQLTLRLLVHGNTEMDINLMPATQDQHIAAYTDDDSNFFNTDVVENSDVESVPPITSGDGGGFGGNVSIGNGNRAGKYIDDGEYIYSAPIDSGYGGYPSSSNDGYDYGKYTSKEIKLDRMNAKMRGDLMKEKNELALIIALLC